MALLTPVQNLATTGVKIFEGNSQWMYLDIKGLVTIGSGYLVQNLSEAIRLNFLDPSLKENARVDAIAKDFLRVRAMAPAKLFTYYRIDSSPLLAQSTIDSLIGVKLNEFHYEILELLPELETYPDGVQAGLLLLTYAVGAKGLAQYHELLADIRQGEWAAAGTNSAISGKAYKDRNTYTAKLFQTNPSI